MPRTRSAGQPRTKWAGTLVTEEEYAHVYKHGNVARYLRQLIQADMHKETQPDTDVSCSQGHTTWEQTPMPTEATLRGENEHLRLQVAFLQHAYDQKVLEGQMRIGYSK